MRETAYTRQRMEAAFLRAFKVDDWSQRGGTCAYCRDRIRRSDLTGDHVRPRAKGGTTRWENIRAACQPCNLLKGSLSEKAFKKLLSNPPADASLMLMMAHCRRRINLRTERAVRRILLYVGLPEPQRKAG